MYSGGSGLSIDIHFVDIELSYDVLSPLPTLLSKHFNHPHPYIEIATPISDTYVCTIHATVLVDFFFCTIKRLVFSVYMYMYLHLYLERKCMLKDVIA